MEAEKIVIYYNCCIQLWDIENEMFKRIRGDNIELFDINHDSIKNYDLDVTGLEDYVTTIMGDERIYEYIQGVFKQFCDKKVNSELLFALFKKNEIIISFVAFIRCLCKLNIISEYPDSQTSFYSDDTTDDEPDKLFMHSCRFTSFFIYCFLTENTNSMDIMDNTMKNSGKSIDWNWDYLSEGILLNYPETVDDGADEEKDNIGLRPGYYAIQILIRYKNLGFQPWHTFICYILDQPEQLCVLSSWRTGDTYTPLEAQIKERKELDDLLTLKKKSGLRKSLLKDPDTVQLMFGARYGVQANQERVVRFCHIN